MVLEARGVAENNKSEPRMHTEEDLALLLTAIKSEPEIITVTGQVTLKAMCETSVIVST